MDQVVDSLNEIMASVLQESAAMDGDGSGDGSANNLIMNRHSSPVVAVASDVPSFHYFLSEQAKSIIALQELQNEVGALLEFRDLVMDAFPQLGHKIPTTFNHPLRSQSALSPSKWEPGIRVKRKLGQQLRDPDFSVPSLMPRYRSNSQGKMSRNSEVSGSATSSAIQDSGFCTDSNKDHSSAISNRSKSRETDDELFSLLDHIHNKGTRLKLEVEYLWSRLNRKGNSSFAGTNKRRCKSLDDLILTNGAAQSFTFECAVKTAFLETELSSLKRERTMLLKKMNDIESEHLANLAQTNRLLLELETISAEKRDLEERLQVAIHSESSHMDDNDLHHNFLTRNHWRGAQTPLAKGQLMNLMQVFKDTQHTSDDNSPTPFHHSKAVSSTPVSKDSYYTPEHSREPNEETPMVCRPTSPVTKEFDSGQSASKDRVADRVSTLSGDGAITLASTKDFNGETSDNKSDCGASVKLDILAGFSSGHLPSIDQPPTRGSGVTLSKEKVLNILNEYDPATLHRFLLTLSYHIEALNAHVQRISNSRLNVYHQLNKFKAENEDLKFRLEEKNIQLEGTKAKVRVLERMRNEKLSYSTSDLMMGIPKSDSRFTCPVSDTGLMTEKTATALSGQNSTKCVDLRDPSDRKSSSCRRSVSKIPLKTPSSSKLPTKSSSNSNSNNNNNNNNNKKTLTSFKEYSAPGPPHSSCISYTSSSLSNK